MDEKDGKQREKRQDVDSEGGGTRVSLRRAHLSLCWLIPSESIVPVE